MKNISIWKDNFKNIKYQPLKENKKVDVLIIGGGITGISTLYHLNDSKLNVILVEQNKIGFSVTGNSTGKLSYLQNDLIDKIRVSFNDKIALEYLKSQKATIKTIVNLINRKNINCDLQKTDSYIYTNKEEEINKIKDLANFLKENNIKIENKNNNLIKYKYIFNVSDTYVINPIKFIYGLLKNINKDIYENTSIKKIEKKHNYYLCYTDKYKIEAKYVVIASYYPYFIIPYLFPLKESIKKSYISASKYSIKPLSLISYSKPFISIRNYNDYLIYLSNSHSVNTKVCDRKNYEELLKKIKKLNLKHSYMWSNIDIITNDGLPYIGKIKNNLLIGTGYNTWGLTNGFLAGKILSDIINNKNNEYIDLFNPNRINIKQFSGGVINIYKTLSGYVNGFINKNSNVDYKKINNENLMIYNNKEEYIVYNRCPHVGCKLIFNDIEKTWDCPCHGSRFNINGKCISGPSNEDITYNKK